MTDHLRGMQLAVEAPADGVLLVRVAGQLTGRTGPRLLRLLDSLTGRDGVLRARPRRMVVDLGNVWVFDGEGVAVLEHARHAATCRGVRFALGGLDDGRLEMLPRRIERALRALGAAAVPALPAPRPAPGAAVAVR